jgi:manganese oxidase
MYISPNTSRIRQREAQRARDNRAEIVKARSLGQVTRRDLIRWGIFTASSVLACKNGLSPLAPSTFATVPTGTPRSPLFGGKRFAQPMNRLNLQHPVPITPYQRGSETDAVFGGSYAGEPHARRLSYHTDFSNPPAGKGPACASREPAQRNCAHQEDGENMRPPPRQTWATKHRDGSL